MVYLFVQHLKNKSMDEIYTLMVLVCASPTKGMC